MARAPREGATSEAPGDEEGDGGQVEFRPRTSGGHAGLNSLFWLVGSFLFSLFVWRIWGGDLGDTPTMTAQAGPGVGKGYTGG